MSDQKNLKKMLPEPPFHQLSVKRDIQHLEEFGEIKKLSNSVMFSEKSKNEEISTINDFRPIDYLNYIQSSIPNEFISKSNYNAICDIASFFNGKISSFFGFETQLHSEKAQSDFLFAISSLNGEKEALNKLIHTPDFRSYTHLSNEWNHLRYFIDKWCQKDSIINKKIHGLWLEFDIKDEKTNLLEPCVFFHMSPIYNNSDYNWVIHDAIPSLTGKNLPNHLNESLKKAIEYLPDGAYVMDIGFMLSRSEEGMRLLINKIKPKEIVQYLKKIGLSKIDMELESLIKELQKQVSRIVLHIAIGKKLIPKIGIECSFAPDRYSQENGWENFFKFLKEKQLCNSIKQKALTQYIGSDLNDESSCFNFDTFIPSVKNNTKNTTVFAITRYISHIKIIYEPGKPLLAKAYPGVRVFNKENQ